MESVRLRKASNPVTTRSISTWEGHPSLDGAGHLLQGRLAHADCRTDHLSMLVGDHPRPHRAGLPPLLVPMDDLSGPLRVLTN